MKNAKQNARHQTILTLISEEHIETQEDLIRKLKEQGVSCTQATVSRDIKELKLIKIADDNGKYRYAAVTKEEGRLSAKYDKIIRETIISATAAGNLVVIKTYPGMANAACAAIDALRWDGVVGTIAGDDTIFTAVHNDECAGWITDRIHRLLQ